MKVSFNQPGFIPWGGVFARLLRSDKMVLLDDTLLARGFTFVTRNRIKGPFGEVWISVPVKRKGRGRQKIRDLEIYQIEKWQRNFLETLRHFYGKSIHFESIFTEIKTAVEAQDDTFLNIIFQLFLLIKTGLDIETGIILQSNLGIADKGTSLLVSLAKELKADEVTLPYFSQRAVEWDKFRKEKIKVRFLRYSPPQYPQFWGGFIKNLSALDLLLCCGKGGRKVLEKGIFLYDGIDSNP